MNRDIDEIIQHVKLVIPDVDVAQLTVVHPGVDDDGLWYFQLPGIRRDLQIESPTGMCPFIFEDSDMKSGFDALTLKSVDEVVAKIVLYLSSLR